MKFLGAIAVVVEIASVLCLMVSKPYETWFGVLPLLLCCVAHAIAIPVYLVCDRLLRGESDEPKDVIEAFGGSLVVLGVVFAVGFGITKEWERVAFEARINKPQPDAASIRQQVAAKQGDAVRTAVAKVAAKGEVPNIVNGYPLPSPLASEDLLASPMTKNEFAKALAGRWERNAGKSYVGSWSKKFDPLNEKEEFPDGSWRISHANGLIEEVDSEGKKTVVSQAVEKLVLEYTFRPTKQVHGIWTLSKKFEHGEGAEVIDNGTWVVTSVSDKEGSPLVCGRLHQMSEQERQALHPQLLQEHGARYQPFTNLLEDIEFPKVALSKSKLCYQRKKSLFERKKEHTDKRTGAASIGLDPKEQFFPWEVFERAAVAPSGATANGGMPSESSLQDLFKKIDAQDVRNFKP